MNNLVEMFSYSFMVRAFIAGILISLSAALIGTPLVLKKNSMLGDGLSHVAFGAFALAVVLGLAPTFVAIPLVILASFFILRLNNSSKIHGDAAIALMSASALAIGTFIISIAGTNIDINSYLFGSILSVGENEVILSLILLAAIISIYIIFHNKIFAITFDENFARAVGTPVGTYNLLLAVLIAVIIVLAMNLVGSLLISALVIFPALSAMRVFNSFRSVIICSAVFSVVCAFLGMLLSILAGTPVGATVVIIDMLAFGLFYGVGVLKNGGR